MDHVAPLLHVANEQRLACLADVGGDAAPARVQLAALRLGEPVADAPQHPTVGAEQVHQRRVRAEGVRQLEEGAGEHAIDVERPLQRARRLVQERSEGRAILLVSLELEEILSLSDRILVVYEGEIVGEHTGEVSEDEIGLEMLGGREQAAA